MTITYSLSANRGNNVLPPVNIMLHRQMTRIDKLSITDNRQMSTNNISILFIGQPMNTFRRVQGEDADGRN